MKEPVALVIYRKQLGDVLLLQPALEYLVQQGFSVRLDTRPSFVDLLSLMPGNIRLQSGWGGMPNRVYCMESRIGAILKAVLAPARHRFLCLTSDKAKWWYKWAFSEYRTLPKESVHVSLAHYLLLGGRRSDFSPPRLNPPPPSWQPEGVPDRYLLLHPTAAWARKSWPEERWSRVLQRLDTNLPIVMTSGGAAWEVAMVKRIAEAVGDRQIISLGGKTSLRQYISVISRARAVFCVDGSASHLAAAFRVPAVTLFGPTNAMRWFWPTARHICLKASDYTEIRKPPTAAIPENAVLEAVQSLLASDAV